MRNTLFIAALVALTQPCFAQEEELVEETPIEEKAPLTAASKFYRAFWLEQAGSKPGEAENLYAKVVADHPKSPEAPRALLAIIRIRSGRGEPVDLLVSQFIEAYPDALREIARAKKFEAQGGAEFDASPRTDDTPTQKKLKSIYNMLSSYRKISTEDQDFLSDMGAAGHSMLARLLHSTVSSVVRESAGLLLRQKTAQANIVVESALRNPTILYRMTIIDQVRRSRAFDLSMMRTLREIWPQASRSLRRRIAWTWAAGSFEGNPAIAKCYEYLAVALADEDPEVRRSATSVGEQNSHDARPAAYVAALIPLCLKNDPSVRSVWSWFPWQVKHKELADQVAEAVGRYPGYLTYSVKRGWKTEVVDQVAALAMAKFVVARSRMKLTKVSYSSFAQMAARSSGAAASLMLESALRDGESDLARAVLIGLEGAGISGEKRDRFVSNAESLRKRALEQSYAKDEDRASAARMVLSTLALRVADLPVILNSARAHPEQGLVPNALEGAYLRALGPDRVAQLVPLATKTQLAIILRRGLQIKAHEGDALLSALLKRFSPTKDYWGFIVRLLQSSDELTDVLPAWILDQRHADFGWSLPGTTVNGRKSNALRIIHSKAIRKAFGREPLRSRILKMTADPRREVGETAMAIASQKVDAASTAAVGLALQSPWKSIVKLALFHLKARGPEGAAILVTFLQRTDVDAELRRQALNAFRDCDAKEQLEYIRGQLDKRVDGNAAFVMWDHALQYDHDATVNRALTEVFGGGPQGYRVAALHVLTRASDERRVSIFRKVLRESKDSGIVRTVLRAVADQYLIELGPEVLLQLRNPDTSVRQDATKAIERLKFYAEAKKILDNPR